ncbi:hypothetical protein ACHAO1_002980 [Botrytis cinerea]
MAVLENVRGVKVTVCTDDQVLQEYDDDEPEDVPAVEVGGYDRASKTVSKYIEATTGKAVYIKLEITKAYKLDSPIVSFHVFVDGIQVVSKHGGKKDIPLTMEVKGVKNELDNRQAFMMQFKFGDIITSTDDSKLASSKEDATRLSAVGEIMVKVYRKSKQRPSASGKRPRVNLAVDKSMLVHEKALKGRAMSPGTVLGAPQPISASRHSRSSFLDGKDYPIAIFQFKYRSKESLKSLLILERTPEPSPSPPPAPVSNGASGPFDLESLDATQKAKLQEFLGNLMGNGAQFKGERKIKREREETDSKTNKRSKRGKRVEIDLTGDNSD